MTSLKLFRSTGYESLFEVGEARVATHPGWIILTVSLWVGLICNPVLWSVAQGQLAPGVLLKLLEMAALVGGALALVLGLLAWGALLSWWAFALLAAAGWLAALGWTQGLSPAAALTWDGWRALARGPLLPWQLAVSLSLAVLPHALWLYLAPLKRISSGRSLRIHLATILLGGAVFAAAAYRLFPAWAATWPLAWLPA